MFNNIGRKIKTLACILCGIGILISCIIGIVFIYNSISSNNDGNLIIGILILIAGSCLSWINSFVLYGFGHLVENSEIIADNTDLIVEYRNNTTRSKY